MNNSVYENKVYIPEGPFSKRKTSMGQDILPESGLRTLSRLDNTPMGTYGKASDLKNEMNYGEKM